MSKQSREKDRSDAGELNLGLGGIFKGLGDLVEKLGELAEKGGELTRSGEIRSPGGEKGLKGVYGFTVKVGLGGEGLKVEPFGNIGKDAVSGRSVVHEFREPLVDVFEEKDYVLVVAEMPGISVKDVQLDLQEDLLCIEAKHGDQKYRKEILLPGAYAREKMEVSCNNGVLEIRCKK
ncbi:MAG: Hsp20/alpha crystallin family protein [Planctomycetes bacterium]|nr:Hsp20/alpha crystallin family protein [Planctomycetota bacterium]